MDEAIWHELGLALSAHRFDDAIRLACAAWAHHRAPILADLIETLDGYVDADPSQTPSVRAPWVRATAPPDPARLGARLAWMERNGFRIRRDRDSTADWVALVRRHERTLATIVEHQPDPRIATLVARLLFDMAHARASWPAESFEGLVALLREIADIRLVPSMLELATSPGRGSNVARELASVIDRIEVAARERPSIAEVHDARVAGWLERYRDEADRLVASIQHAADDVEGEAEVQVASDALSEIGHPYGELVALQLKEQRLREIDRRIIGEGRARIAKLLACHEERWIGRDLVRVLDERVYRAGVLVEAALRYATENDIEPSAWEAARNDPRIARVRALRAGSVPFGFREPRARAPRVWDHSQGLFIIGSRSLVQGLERLDAPTASFLRAIYRTSFPKLLEVALFNPNDAMLELLGAWSRLLPSLRELRFVGVPMNGVEGLVKGLDAEGLITPRRELALKPPIPWDTPRHLRDLAIWFRLLHARSVDRASVRHRGTRIHVEWPSERERDGLVVSCETDEGGEVVDVLGDLPAKVARLVFRDPPEEKHRKIDGFGRLRRILDTIAPQEVEMPTRWRHQLERLSSEGS